MAMIKFLIITSLTFTIFAVRDESHSFGYSVRKFWAKAIELATTTKNIDQIGSPYSQIISSSNHPNYLHKSTIPETILVELENHFMNANPMIFEKLIKEQDQTLEIAGLSEWVEIIRRKLKITPDQIVEKYWQDSITEKEKQQFDHVIGKSYSRLTAICLYSLQVMPQFVVQKIFDRKSIPMFRKKMISFVLTVRSLMKSSELMVSDFVNVREVLLDPEVGLNLDALPSALKSLFDRGVVEYFNHMDVSMMGKIISGILELPVEKSKSKVEVLMVALNRVWPGMQKLMQMFGEEAKNSNLKAYLDTLKDNIEPMNDIERNLVVFNAFGGFNVWKQSYTPHWTEPYYLERMNKVEGPLGKLIKLKKRIGAASIGEGWIATMKFNKDDQPEEEVFVKLMRWDVEYRMDEEIRFLEKIKKDEPTLTSVLDDLISSLKQEVDFDAEFANQLLGYKRYSFESTTKGTQIPKNILHVPMPIGVFSNGKGQAIVMPVEPGKTVKKTMTDGSLRPKDACKLVDLQSKLTRTWFRNLLTGEHNVGHGDIHPGNILVSFHPITSLSYYSVLDWGNIIKLSPETRNLLIIFGTGVLTNNQKMVLNGLGVSEQNTDLNIIQMFTRIVAENFSIMKQLMQRRKKKPSSLSTRLERSSSTRTTSSVDLDETQDGENSVGETKKPSLFRPLFGRKPTSAPEEAQVTEEEIELEGEGDLFHIRSKQKQIEILKRSEFSLVDSLMILIENILADAIEVGIAIPKGFSPFFRAKKFLDVALVELENHPAVKTAGCKVPQGASAYRDAIMSLKEATMFVKNHGAMVVGKVVEQSGKHGVLSRLTRSLSGNARNAESDDDRLQPPDESSDSFHSIDDGEFNGNPIDM